MPLRRSRSRSGFIFCGPLATPLRKDKLTRNSFNEWRHERIWISAITQGLLLGLIAGALAALFSHDLRLAFMIGVIWLPLALGGALGASIRRRSSKRRTRTK